MNQDSKYKIDPKYSDREEAIAKLFFSSQAHPTLYGISSGADCANVLSSIRSALNAVYGGPDRRLHIKGSAQDRRILPSQGGRRHAAPAGDRRAKGVSLIGDSIRIDS